MASLSTSQTATRYDKVGKKKSTGATYTPPELADFVASEMAHVWKGASSDPIKILDPAVGEGVLLASLLNQLPTHRTVAVYGYDSNPSALTAAAKRLEHAHPKAVLHLACDNFLNVVCGDVQIGSLFASTMNPEDTFDMVIANPPYVRTQIMGADAAQSLALQYGLTGRVDLYHAFLLAIAKVLRPHGVAGIIVSNRFMTTRAGATVRRAIQEQFHLHQVFDLGDTKIFDAAVLPAVLIAEGLNGTPRNDPTFTSIYETKNDADSEVSTITAALTKSGVVRVPDGRRFLVQRGSLDTTNDIKGVWRVATKQNEIWLSTVEKNTWHTFRMLGKIRVGVKTCADRVFIRDDWQTLPAREQPELMRPLTTHHVGRRFRADSEKSSRCIVYPHEFVDGKRRAIDLAKYPRTRRYLEKNRDTLESRLYVIEAGRNWYELWVPQDPAAWHRPKLVFRDITEEPCFWVDRDGTIVNGDCYWLVCDDETREDLLWLAVSVGNSTFIEAFYDHRFNNKLYAGRRRFITQYVEKFPLPDPTTPLSNLIIAKAKQAYEAAGSERSRAIEREIDALVWKAFGLPVEKVRR